MAVVPKKLSFQLRFRSKTKTRKILNRDLRLQGLLKKDSSDSNSVCNAVVKKEQQLLLKKRFCSFLKINTQRTEDTRITKAGRMTFKNSNYLYLKLPEASMGLETHSVVKKKARSRLFTHFVEDICVSSGLNQGARNHYCLVKPNKYSHVYKKKPFLRLSWSLTNRITINSSNYINLKKIEDSNRLSYGSGTDYNTFKPETFLNTDRVPNKDKLLSCVFKPASVYLKKKAVPTPRVNRLLFGRYGICFRQYSIISSKCAETAKLDIAKSLRKKGRSWIRICCDTPISARPAETRMGKGKGSISHWAAKVSPGQLFFEFSGVSRVQLKEIYQKLCKKSAVSLKII